MLAERRAQRAEQAEQSAARRAADAQVLAAQLARERARLEAERDAARAEAAAAREGADAAIAEARHLQAERDALRAQLEAARAERRDAQASEPADPARAEPPDAPAAGIAGAAHPARSGVAGGRSAGARPGPGRQRKRRSCRNGHAAPPFAWAAGAAARAGRRTDRGRDRDSGAGAGSRTRRRSPALARERRLVAQRAAGGLAAARGSALATAAQPRGDRAAPITALALERERSSRLQAQLDSSLAVQRELRTHIAALQRAVHQRVEAERRIEAALRRVREELTAASLLATQRAHASAAAVERAAPAAPFPPAAPAPAGPPRAAAGTAAPSVRPMPPVPAVSGSAAPLPPIPAPPAPTGAGPQAAAPAETSPSPDPIQHAPAPSPAQAPPAAVPAPSAPAASPPEARVGLDPDRLAAARERLRAATAPAPALAPLPEGPPAPWLTAALKHLLEREPEIAGRIAVGLLPAQSVGAQRPLRCDLLLAGRGCLALDFRPGAPGHATPRPDPRARGERDLSVAADEAGIAKLLHGKRGLRRPARVRGGRRALRELRRVARAPLGLRDLGAAGVALEPALALRLVALAIDPAATQGERFAIAHAPLAGGAVDAWLRIADGAPPAVVTQPPPEPTRLTLRCTRGALLALIAGVEPPPGESGTLDGDDAALALLRTWIARTEQPGA